MLLETLVGIVTTNLKVSNLDAVLILKKVIHKIGYKKINIDKLHHDINFDELEEVLKILLEMEVIQESINYSCTKVGARGNCINIHEKCMYCESTVGENEDHEIIRLLSITKDFRKDLIMEIDLKVGEVMLEEYLQSDYKRNFEKLKSKREKIIPFIGSGLSVPINVPSRKGLLLNLKEEIRSGYEQFYIDKLENGDYLGALTYLKEASLLTSDEDISEKLSEYILENIDYRIARDKHNYFDLLKLDSKFYLTTNYDTALSHFKPNHENNIIPLVWSEIENMQKLMDEDRQRIIHLHGIVDKPSTMIVSKESYEKLYADATYKRKLFSIMSNKSLLFIGFSFTDVFFQNLYKDIIAESRGEHFILAPNVEFSDAQKLAGDNLNVIGINIKDNSDYPHAIRVIIESLIS